MQLFDNKLGILASRRRALRYLLALPLALGTGFFLVGCGGGGGGGGGGGATPTTVTGQVLDSANADAGVSGASITIGGVTTTTTTSASATAANPVGSFTIQNASVGANTAKITASGLPAQTIAFSPSVAAGTNPSLTLFINIGQVSGTVLLSNGSPAAGALVASSVNGDFVQTSSNGTFLLTNVPLGTTTITAVLGTASLSQTVTVTNGVTALGSLKLVDSPNPNPPAPPYTISGKVVLGGSGNGAPAQGAQIFLLLNGNQLEVTTADTNGNYTFYVPVGTYQLQYKINFYQPNAQSVTVSNPSTPLSVPTITLTPQ